uniref:Uncharacterized protein n=1 Tax=Zea mays TaxID=4577 RepID=B8A258_MAIZE|nr:unknown [Zea mays]
MYDVAIARNENASTIGPTIPLLDLSSSKGSETVLLPARSGSVPKITPSHTRNRARGMAVPATIAVRTFDRSPSKFVQRTGTTFWYTNERAIIGILCGAAAKFASRRELHCRFPLATTTREVKDARMPTTRTPFTAPINRWLPK